eukprot:GHVU01221133.1.p1 GENE.GHVU01221133.1~~GHVU01221133.1.p1  ORF type:complete len:168 (+),score=8.12 GHVU01221133.1:568-1071(+)
MPRHGWWAHQAHHGFSVSYFIKEVVMHAPIITHVQTSTTLNSILLSYPYHSEEISTTQPTLLTLPEIPFLADLGDGCCLLPIEKWALGGARLIRNRCKDVYSWRRRFAATIRRHVDCARAVPASFSEDGRRQRQREVPWKVGRWEWWMKELEKDESICRRGRQLKSK